MKLPNATDAILPPEKLQDYLLSTTHLVGRYKAAFFRGLGYERDNWRVLERDLRSLLKEDAIELESTEFGQKFSAQGSLTGPNGRSASIVTVWIILVDSDVPRFVTAYPEN
ncbi:MAG: hypothetical protein ACI9W2_003798 [Gammaproteobacteria bacterium]